MNPTNQSNPTPSPIEPIRSIAPSHKFRNLFSMMVVLVLLVGVGFSVMLLRQSQDNRSRASTGQALTITLKPIADAYVSSSESSTNKGNSTKLGVEAGSKTKISYLKFNLSPLAGATIQSVSFRFRVDADPAQSSDTMNVKVVPDTSWNENSITYNNRPSLSGDSLGTISGRNPNTWYTYNFSAAAAQPYAGNIFSFAVQAPSSSSDYLAMLSRENAGYEPQLLITYSQEEESIPTPAVTDSATKIQPFGESGVTPTTAVDQSTMSGSGNDLSILDYNILIGCYSDLLPAVSCTPENKIKSDLNKDGLVNQIDYNLFLRELASTANQ